MNLDHILGGTTLGRAICAWREMAGKKPAHKFGRPYVSSKVVAEVNNGYVHSLERVKSCTRCGHTVAIKPRKPRKQEQQ